jgi:hypothetical protein
MFWETFFFLDLSYRKFVGPALLSTNRWLRRLMNYIVPLKMPRRQKIALLSVVSLSILVIIAAIVRMVFVSGSNNSTDPTCTTDLPTQNDHYLTRLRGPCRCLHVEFR